ncbi:MAG: potassium-transporting ATPase subunit F [Ilumatobacteraceae bacterium]
MFAAAIDNALGLGISFLVLVYLVIVLVFPERF